MRRLPGIILLAGATLIVIVALLVSGLRLVLPVLNTWRPAILEKIETLSGIPVEASQIQANWQTFGPTLDVRDINARLKDGGELKIQRVTLALDVWQSLLHARWQFRDLTFYHLHMRTNTPFSLHSDKNSLKSDKISDLFLRQFDHFDLRDSSLSFLTLSGQRAELTMPKLTWLNSKNRHRAEGQISLSSFNGQHGVADVRMDLRDENGLLDAGKVWLRADDVDVKPWLSRWMNDNTDFQQARFSLAAWMDIKTGEITGGDIWLKKGGASWAGKASAHQFVVDNLMAHIERLPGGWGLAIPSTNIVLDNKSWPKGTISLAWVNPQDMHDKSDVSGSELRLRASNIDLENFNGLLPIATRFLPDLGDMWRDLQPHGHVDKLAIDIPWQQKEKTRFQGQWKNLSWRPWKLIPGMANFSGSAAGSVEHGRLNAQVIDAFIPYKAVFRAPLEKVNGTAVFEWQKRADGFQLDGKHVDVKARSVWARGDFRYFQPVVGEPWLGILAGINVSNAGDAWRYFPENLMSKTLINYLSTAIQGGQAHNATLVYGGNPHLFPYKHNEGQFEVLVPLRNARFAFQHNWPALEGLDITLDFINDGLWMKSDRVRLGGVNGRHLTAVIPRYAGHKLFINSGIEGPANAIGPYFKNTPLNNSIANALDVLQISGDVNANLHLDIPLDGKLTTAKGEVRLRNNALFVKPLNTTLTGLSGKFSFVNGILQSGPLQATWFNQPVRVNFSTKEADDAYHIGINFQGNWRVDKTGILPESVSHVLRGSMPWQSHADITLLHQGNVKYQVNAVGDLTNVSSYLPLPASKASGEPFPIQINVEGDLKGFDLTGKAGMNNHFSSRWLLDKKLILDRARWVADGNQQPTLSGSHGLELDLPAIDGAQWLALLRTNKMTDSKGMAFLPANITLHTPTLTLGGQRWNQLTLGAYASQDGTQFYAQGREIDATLNVHHRKPWLAKINYLYFNPDRVSRRNTDDASPVTMLANSDNIDFHGWPDIQLRCAACWFWGQKYGRIAGDFSIRGDKLRLADGVIDTGFARLSMEGEWLNRPGNMRTSLKGELKGEKINAATNFFGIKSPLQKASFQFDYDLHWRDVPWKPDNRSLNGILRTRLGKGEIADLGTGHTGQLLRLFSFDALLRKLRFDFSDTFGDGFYFDSIRSTAWIKDGIMHTDNLLVDGLEADIAMKGTFNLMNQQLAMEAIVAPEISATVGVATAFALNPIIGAAVFAASQALSPLWNKISVLRYHISGPLDKPKINEVLRQPRVRDVK